MYTKRLKKDEWLRQSLSFLELTNRQFRQVSEDGISFHVDDDASHPSIFIKCSHRHARVAIECYIDAFLQGVCYVRSNSELEWMYTV